jgi:hypothetical protein
MMRRGEALGRMNESKDMLLGLLIIDGKESEGEM